MENEILMDLMMVSMISSVIASQVTQKIKDLFKFGRVFNKIISIIISFWIGFIYSYSFYTDNLLYSFWIALFTLIGSDIFYKVLNDKLGIKNKILIENKKE